MKALRWGKFAQAKGRRVILGNVADFYRSIFLNDFVREALGGFDLLSGQQRRFQVYGAILVAHVKGNRRHIKKPHKRSGENVLSGMLLHVVTAAARINKTANAASFLQREFVFGDSWFEIVNALPLFP